MCRILLVSRSLWVGGSGSDSCLFGFAYRFSSTSWTSRVPHTFLNAQWFSTPLYKVRSSSLFTAGQDRVHLWMSQQRLKIPDPLVGWPWLRTINPHYCEVKADATAWLESFKPFNSKAQAIFNKGDFSEYYSCQLLDGSYLVGSSTIGLLAALVYPLASKGN